MCRRCSGIVHRVQRDQRRQVMTPRGPNAVQQCSSMAHRPESEREEKSRSGCEGRASRMYDDASRRICCVSFSSSSRGSATGWRGRARVDWSEIGTSSWRDQGRPRKKVLDPVPAEKVRGRLSAARVASDNSLAYLVEPAGAVLPNDAESSRSSSTWGRLCPLVGEPGINTGAGMHDRIIARV